MKLKSLFIVAFCAANLGTSHAAPRKETPVNTKPKPVLSKTAPITNDTKIVTGKVVINAVTRNDQKSNTTLILAQNGKALLPIVISAKASDATKAVAKDLADYLGKISGATFKVEAGDGSKGIVLGSMTDFPTPALSKALEIFNGYDGKEAYAIRTRANKVLLLGATDLGASHAAYRFLHEIGCRWFRPHKVWEVIPSTPSLSFARDITDRPQIMSRVVWFEGTTPADYDDWRRRNAQAESFKVSSGGGSMNFAFTKEVLDAHPEYSALWKQADGTLKRDPGSLQFELSNPAVRKIIVDHAVNYFKTNPNADMLSLEPADTTAHSLSPESLKMGSMSDRVFGMANEAARAVEKAYPGQHKMIGLLSYNSYYDPPSFPMEPNVHIQMASIGMNPKYTPEQRYKLWPQRSKNLGVYEYYSVWAWSGDGLPGSYTNGVEGSQHHIRDELVARNVISLSAESTSSWGSNGRGYYVANALLWNPNLDLKALLKDFYDKSFGPGAPAMERYYERLSPDNNPLISGHLYGLAMRDVDEASKAAADRPDVQARLDQIKLYLRFIFIQNAKGQMSKVKGRAIDDDMTIENAYRTSPYALTAWNMISQNWQGNDQYARGKTFPALVPYTHDEIEPEFQEALEYFKPKIRENILPRQKFSEDLVAIKWPNVKPESNNVESKQVYQGSMKYALWSVKGEPLEFMTEASDSWGYKTSFTVTDAKGKVLESGKPDAKVLVTHKVKVPAPGLYYLNYNDPGAYWTFTAKPGLLHSIVMLQDAVNGRAPNSLQPMYFYVPKGVKDLQYFTTNTHSIYGPDGSLQKRVEQANDYISIPVPPGMDGKLWQMRDTIPAWIYFSNAPSYISPTPEGVLVPREVAIKDGLTIRK